MYEQSIVAASFVSLRTEEHGFAWTDGARLARQSAENSERKPIHVDSQSIVECNWLANGMRTGGVKIIRRI